MFTLENRELFNCTKEERKSLIPLILEIVEMAGYARKTGIVAWENEQGVRVGLETRIDGIKEARLRNGVALLVDGHEKELITRILEIQVIASGKTGVELLRQVIMFEGILSLCDGEHPKVVGKKLTAFLGDDIDVFEEFTIKY